MIVRYQENIADLVQSAFTPASARQTRYYRSNEIPAFGIPLLGNHLEVTQISYEGGGYHRSYWLSDVDIKVSLVRHLKTSAMSRGYVIDINSPHFRRFWENRYYRRSDTTIFPREVKGMYFCCEGTTDVLTAMGFVHPLTIRRGALIIDICDELGIDPNGMEVAFVVGPMFTKVYSMISDDIGTLIALRHPELVVKEDSIDYTQRRKRETAY